MEKNDPHHPAPDNLNADDRLSRITESARLGWWDWNIESGELLWSKESLEMFGLPPDAQMSYERFLEAIYPEDRERVHQAVQDAMKTGEEYSTEMRAVWPDGSVHWVASRGRVYFDKSGKPIRMSGAGMDITQFKETEDNLRRARAEAKAHADNLAAILDAVPAVTLIANDPECKRVRSSRFGYELTGLPRGTNVSAAAPSGEHQGFKLVQDGRELSASESPLQEVARTGKEIRNRELELHLANGKVLQLFGHTTPLFDEAGKVRGAVGAFLDITELKRARAEAKAQADNFAAAFDAVPAAAFFSNTRDCREMISNRAAHELLRVPYGVNVSMSAAGAEDLKFKVLDNGRELAPEEMPVQKAALTGEPVRNKEFEIRFEDGSSVYEFGHAVPLFNEKGEVRGAIGAFLDITDRKVMEQRLRRATERFQVALRNTPITVFSQDLDLRYKWMYNPVSGYDVAEILGKRDTDFLERHEDAVKLEAIKKEVMRTGKIYQGEVEIYYAGKPRTYHVTIEPQRDAQNNIIGLTCASFELTERKHAEAEREKLERQRRAALDAAKMGWWHYNAETKTSLWDDTFKNIYGLEVNTGNPEMARARVHPDDLAAAVAKFQKAMDPDDPQPYISEYRVVQPDGPVRWVEIHGGPEFEGEGARRRVVGCSGTIRDITDRKEDEEALRESEERYRNLAKNLDREVQARTRELQERNDELLRASEGLKELSGRLLQIQDEERRRVARELHDSAGQIITSLDLELAALRNRIGQLSPQVADLTGASQGLVQQLHREIRTTSYLLHPPLLDEAGLYSAVSWYARGVSERSGIAVEVQMQEDFGRVPRDVEMAVFRLVQESLTNIHRHSGSKRAKIRIERSDGALVVEIADEGKGMSAERLAAIQSGGSGVGIRGMRERLRQLQGELKIESGEWGTRVVASVPLMQPGFGDEMETARAGRESASSF